MTRARQIITPRLVAAAVIWLAIVLPLIAAVLCLGPQ